MGFSSSKVSNIDGLPLSCGVRICISPGFLLGILSCRPCFMVVCRLIRVHPLVLLVLVVMVLVQVSDFYGQDTHSDDDNQGHQKKDNGV